MVSPKIMESINEWEWTLDESDQLFIASVHRLADAAENLLNEGSLRKGYLEIRKLWMLCNKQFNDWKPWSVKEGTSQKKKYVFLTLEGMRIVGELVSAFAPEYCMDLRLGLSLSSPSASHRLRIRREEDLIKGEAVVSLAPEASGRLFRKKLTL